MPRDSPVAPLLAGAAQGMEWAWTEIIRRYTPLVVSVCRRYQVVDADADDVGGDVWLRLVANLRTIRIPEALPGWLTATTRNECLMLLRHKKRQLPSGHEIAASEPEPEAEAALLVQERRDAVRHAMARLPEREQKLLSMLFSDPPTPYTTISSVLGIPMGTIGPTRQRCLARMRRNPTLTSLLLDECHRHSNKSPSTELPVVGCWLGSAHPGQRQLPAVR
jgi:RNA polymerase sigma factor (sigma-70 family)